MPPVPSTTSPRLYAVNDRVTFPSKRRFLPDQAKVGNSRFLLGQQQYLSQLSRPINMKALATGRGVPHSFVHSHRRENHYCSSCSSCSSLEVSQIANCNPDKEIYGRGRMLSLVTSVPLVDLVLIWITLVLSSSFSLSHLFCVSLDIRYPSPDSFGVNLVVPTFKLLW